MKHIPFLTLLLLTQSPIFSQPEAKVSKSNLYQYFLVIINSDDEMFAFVNGNRIHYETTENDRTLNVIINITPFLQGSVHTGYVNKLEVHGYNGPTNYEDYPVFFRKVKDNPWHFKYVVQRKNTITGVYENMIIVDEKGPSPKQVGPRYLGKTWSHDIVKE